MNPERVFIDTNLFLRYFTNDVPAQAEAVEDLLRRASAGKIILVTSSLVIAEIVWTLESFYKLPRKEIRDKVLAIFNTPGLEMENGDLILQSISWYTEKNIDFIDAYNAAWLLSQDMKTVYTFNRKHFSRLRGLTVKVPGQKH
ncbi:MAG: type II toxin-antitoxin system VapC family toxin [Bacteroidales bacterium]|nr:type II toxin-antitoxin system VapC family toxin [Bacteroidales bacterium]